MLPPVENITATPLKSVPEPPGYLTDEVPKFDDDKQLTPIVSELQVDGVIIRSGLDAANHLLSLRDDGDPALTVRSMVLGSLLAAFQASMNQIYQFKPTSVTLSGSFIVLILWFLGQAWARILPRGDLLEERWRAKTGGQGPLPFYIKIVKWINPCSFGLKEHAVASITASSASNVTIGIQVFTVQNLYYGQPLNGTTVVLATLSIGLFGYGLTGILSPVTVNAVESVYWTNIPVVKVLQSLHWETIKLSKPIRWFWYCFSGMAIYEFLPAYIFPWLNSVSIPCLAGMHTKGNRASIITNLFGGSLSNEGLGILSLSFDWQYITSFATSMPLKQQANSALGIVICYIAFIAVYYGNAWNAKNYPFLATTLRAADGSKYNSSAVFIDGILDESKLEQVGLPHVTGTYAWSMMIGNAAIGALIAHCFIFWGKDIWRTLKNAKNGGTEDPHHLAIKKYKQVSWTWYLAILVVSFVMGLVVVIKENITLPAWAYIIALILGIIVSPFSAILYARYGNGIATSQLMKMLAGVIIPGRPLGNLYFTAWSHSVISESLNLASDLKMGQYLKIPPRVMVLTQIWGTVLGAFINYVVMISIVNSHRALLIDTNGTYAWSGQTFQSLNTQATTWALAKYLYTTGSEYFLIPIGLVIGFGLVVVHKFFCRFVPRIGSFATSELNVAVVLLYSGWLAFNQTESCIILTPFILGFYVQYYLRNYRPRLFKDYSYLVTAAFDGGSLLTVFILSFAVFGASGKTAPFPYWWGNPDGNPDYCPETS